MHTNAEKRQALADIFAAHPGTDSTAQCARIRAALARFALTTWVFRTNVTAGFGIVTEDFGPS